MDTTVEKKTNYFGYKLFRPLISFALVVFLLITFFTFPMGEQPGEENLTTHLFLSVNPSFDIVLNKEMLVTEIRPLNADAVRILYNQEFTFITLSETLLFLENRIIALEYVQNNEVNFNYAFLTKRSNENNVDNILSNLFTSFKENNPNSNFNNLPKQSNQNNYEYFSLRGREFHSDFNDNIFDNDDFSSQILENIFDFREERKKDIKAGIDREVKVIEEGYGTIYSNLEELEDLLDEEDEWLSNLIRIRALINSLSEFNFNLEINTIEDLMNSKEIIEEAIEDCEDFLEEQKERAVEKFLKKRGQSDEGEDEDDEDED